MKSRQGTAMKNAAIIAEYNPFHNGHAWHISETRRLTGADHVLVIMSPDFVQRGEPAVTDKYTRTAMALAGGADAVFELPVPFAAGSAQLFARGAVRILHSMRCADVLSFGCEDGHADRLGVAARILDEESPVFKHVLKDSLGSGRSYPASLQAALAACIKDEIKTPLLTPNNILAIEYIRAIRQYAPAISILPIPRRGAGYLDDQLPGNSDESTEHPNSADPAVFTSALALRRHLLENAGRSCTDILQKTVPADCLSLLNDALRENGLPDEDQYSAMMHHALLRAVREKSLCRFPDISPDLERRIVNTIDRYTSFREYADLLHTKNVTLSRVRRALLHVLLDIRKENAARPDNDAAPGYVRLLGMKKSASPLLHAIRNESVIPVITKPADAGKLLSPDLLAAFKKDMDCSSLYHSVLRGGRAKKRSEYTRSPVIVDL